MNSVPASAATYIIASPFGGNARLVQTLTVSTLVDKYKSKCGLDVSQWFSGLGEIHLYECVETGFRFWQPVSVAGDEDFYRSLGTTWIQYYRTDRWEYAIAREFIRNRPKVLEIGAGRGYFLQSLEGLVQHAVGLELNREAISTKVTSFPIEHVQLDEIAQRNAQSFDVVCAFQVLEHIADPCKLLRNAVRCLRKDGLVILSTPNLDYAPFRQQNDAFDLPPHHVGHFNEQIFRNVATKLQLEVIAFRTEDRSYTAADNKLSTDRPIARRYATKILGRICNEVYRFLRTPGPNIVVVMRNVDNVSLRFI